MVGMAGPKLPYVSADKLPLRIAINEIVYAAECQRCRGGTVQVDLRYVQRLMGPDATVGEIRARLVCSQCGSREPITCKLWLSATMTAASVQRWVPARFK